MRTFICVYRSRSTSLSGTSPTRCEVTSWMLCLV